MNLNHLPAHEKHLAAIMAFMCLIALVVLTIAFCGMTPAQ